MTVVSKTQHIGVRPTKNTADTPAGKRPIAVTSTLILAATTDRASFIIRNTGAVSVFFRLADNATVDDMELEEGDIYFCDDYAGIVDGIVSSGTGEIRVIEA